jgi:polyisoprenoid-binding protein YceI
MMKKYLRPFSFSALLLILAAFTVQEGDLFISNNGTVRFSSQAPLETIRAESKKLSGVLDVARRTYAFTVLINSFEGFNSPLQKEHFNENYMESDKIPSATFKGKIIEEVDLKTPGTYDVRAKGMMKIHGVEKEMIVKAKLVVKSGLINVTSNFSVMLKDFNINVPNIVNQKIASEIKVEVKMDMTPKK